MITKGNEYKIKGSGCGSVGRVVASDSVVISSIPDILKIYVECLLSTVLKFEKTKKWPKTRDEG